MHPRNRQRLAIEPEPLNFRRDIKSTFATTFCYSAKKPFVSADVNKHVVVPWWGTIQRIQGQEITSLTANWNPSNWTMDANVNLMGMDSGISGQEPTDFGGDANFPGNVKGYLIDTFPPFNVVFDGNSITNGFGCPYPFSHILMRRWLAEKDYRWRHRNFGVNAQTTRDMTADAVTQVDSKFNARYTRNICIAWEIINDLTAGQTIAQAKTNFATYVTNRKSAGWTVGSITMLPHNVHSEVTRQDINDWHRAGSDGADFFIDVENDSRIGSSAANLTETFLSDHLHLSDIGQAILAEMIGPAIRAHLP